MRILTWKEKNKRGCLDCADMVITLSKDDARVRCRACIHDVCPYHELDQFDTYKQFLKSDRKDVLAVALEKLFNRTERILEDL
jgi:hypothetical protein